VAAAKSIKSVVVLDAQIVAARCPIPRAMNLNWGLAGEQKGADCPRMALDVITIPVYGQRLETLKFDANR